MLFRSNRLRVYLRTPPTFSDIKDEAVLTGLDQEALEPAIEMAREHAGPHDLGQALSAEEPLAFSSIGRLAQEITLPYHDNHEARTQVLTDSSQCRHLLVDPIPGLTAVNNAHGAAKPVVETVNFKRHALRLGPGRSCFKPTNPSAVTGYPPR